MNRKEFYIRVWDALAQEDACLYAERIKLRRFSYIGEVWTSLPEYPKEEWSTHE